MKIESRIIGITHRIKQKKDQEARPTLVTITTWDGAATVMQDLQRFKLATEQDELDFLNGRCPIKWCMITNPMEDISGFPRHQVKFRAAKDEDSLIGRHASQCVYKNKRQRGEGIMVESLVEVAVEVPIQWIGIQHGDTVAMCLGGSGDYFAFALSRKLDSMRGSVIRIPPFKLKQWRGANSKDDDADLLAYSAVQFRDQFYDTYVRDRGIIMLRIAYRNLMECMRQRIACEQRLGQYAIGTVFCKEEGEFPEGSLEKIQAELKASDPVLAALLAAESGAEKKLMNAVMALDIWDKVFEPIPGVGPKITARIVNSVIDIRRFQKASQFVKFMGVHVLADGRFPRHRKGEGASWHPDGRQALYLLADQFNRQAKKGTKWGDYLIKTKGRLRLKHPEVVLVEGKKRYTDGHIHKMAVWRTLTRFAEWLWREWWELERSAAQSGSQEQKAA